MIDNILVLVHKIYIYISTDFHFVILEFNFVVCNYVIRYYNRKNETL